jgi:hypothetical protein
MVKKSKNVDLIYIKVEAWNHVPSIFCWSAVDLVPVSCSVVQCSVLFVLTNPTEQSPWKANSSSDSQKNSLYCMEPEGSLLHSQGPATGPCPESDE